MTFDNKMTIVFSHLSLGYKLQRPRAFHSRTTDPGVAGLTRMKTTPKISHN